MISKGEKANLIISVISGVSLIIALILNYFRTEWFGVIKGYAPHNFGFNFTYFLPLIFLSLVTAFISMVWLFSKWKIRQNKIYKWITLVLFLPTICCFFIMLVSIFQMLRIQY